MQFLDLFLMDKLPIMMIAVGPKAGKLRTRTLVRWHLLVLYDKKLLYQLAEIR